MSKNNYSKKLNSGFQNMVFGKTPKSFGADFNRKGSEVLKVNLKGGKLL